MRLRYVQLTRLVAVDEAAAVEAALDELLQSDHAVDFDCEECLRTASKGGHTSQANPDRD